MHFFNVFGKKSAAAAPYRDDFLKNLPLPHRHRHRGSGAAAVATAAAPWTSLFRKDSFFFFSMYVLANFTSTHFEIT
jgi:hypothetical protein